jgi:hypothetical protein
VLAILVYRPRVASTADVMAYLLVCLVQNTAEIMEDWGRKHLIDLFQCTELSLSSALTWHMGEGLSVPCAVKSDS